MSLSAMTVYERLYALGLMNEFDRACDKRELNEIERILKLAKADDKPISSIIEEHI